MPLSILLPLVAVGIGGLVLLVHLLGWTRRPTYAAAEEAASAFLADYPDAAPQETALADDGRAALIALTGGVGFVQPLGDGRLTRLLRPEDLDSLQEHDDRLTIATTDFTAPRLEIRLSDPETRARWRARFNALKEPAP